MSAVQRASYLTFAEPIIIFSGRTRNAASKSPSSKLRRREREKWRTEEDENCVALSLAIRDGEQRSKGVKSEKNLTAETIASNRLDSTPGLLFLALVLLLVIVVVVALSSSTSTSACLPGTTVPGGCDVAEQTVIISPTDGGDLVLHTQL